MPKKVQRRGSQPARPMRVVVALCCASICACAAKPPPPRPALPEYGGEQAALFSDLFRPELFRIDGPEPPESDALLAERVRRSDYIGTMRVVTVARETRGDSRNYVLAVRATAPPLRGSSPSDAVSLRVNDRSPAFGWLEGAGDQWVGTELLLFMRFYTDGTHYFATVDSPEVRAAVQAAAHPRAAQNASIEPRRSRMGSGSSP